MKLRTWNAFLAILLFCANIAHGQHVKPSSKFDQFNKKAEALFRILPVPLYSRSSEAGNIFGIAKNNLFHLKDDTISQPSRFSEIGTISTNGRVNISISNDLIFSKGKYMLLSYANYKKQPEYILGIGNDVSLNDVEQIQFERLKFSTTFIRKSVGKHGYAGVSLDISNYSNIHLDSNSFIVTQNIAGQAGGQSVGFGFCVAWDSRDNRYNAHAGIFAILNFLDYTKVLGSDYKFSKMELDVRKYYIPWYKHVIAFQATTSHCFGNVPFYDLVMMGGEDKMRGYYKGALRDKTLIDTQVEYRIPIWGIFGMTGWVGTGRVGSSYRNLSLDGLWLSYGAGVRVRVDSKNNTNLRFDFGFGPKNISGFYINFAEAF